MSYTTIVGMEIHVELATQSKMFCGCHNDPFYAKRPNIYTCPVCLGMPGGLPVPNKKAIEWTIKLGLALGCQINQLSKFDRKNYFYPDLAKGYQISQYDLPFCTNGLVRLDEGDVRITRVHLEEDTGKLLHTMVDGEKKTLIDFNRSGVPLVEIVTEPDIRSGDHAKAFLKRLHRIVRYLNISGADMEKGSMRLEPNISIKSKSQKSKLKITPNEYIESEELPTYKVEVKNINSFNFVKKAIDFEVARHVKIFESGETPKQETRGWDENKGETFSQRSKEDAMDYRYFPEPDIPPFTLSDTFIEEIRNTLPELPHEKENRFMKAYALSSYDASILTETKDRADYFESVVALSESSSDWAGITPKMIVNKILNKKIDGEGETPQEVLTSIKTSNDANLIDESEITRAVDSVISGNEKAVADYRSGKTTVLMFLVGQVKRTLKGKGDAKIIETLLTERLVS